MSNSTSLAKRVTMIVSLGLGLFWLAAVLASLLVLRAEQEELVNLEIKQTAHRLLLILMSDANDLDSVSQFSARTFSPFTDEDQQDAPVWALVDRAGHASSRSYVQEDTEWPEQVIEDQFSRTSTHTFYTTAFSPEGLGIQYGIPNGERNEAYRESALAFLFPMLAFLPLGYLFIGWITRLALAPLSQLRNDIEERGNLRLDPIDSKGLPTELKAITATLNVFMTRLAQALESERTFATNAAHELRTPVAVALAQIQRLRSEEKNPDTQARAIRVEEALKRMSRLVARLLQLARADAGIGASEVPHDLVRLIKLVLEDSQRDSARAALLAVNLPDKPVLSQIDPDAFAIVAGNLIDNAFQHSKSNTPISVSLSPDGVLEVKNESDFLPDEVLTTLPRRFRQSSANGDGFGLGLNICDTIARQSGGYLKLSCEPTKPNATFIATFGLP
jgi:two-component system, OmpR family, sensor kinase